MLQNALREYDPVSADASPTAAAGAPPRLAVDVRRFPWMRPLSGDYAFNFSNVAPLYAGDPQSPEAWRETAGRVRARARQHGEVAAAITAQQTRRGAPAESQAAAALLARSDASAIVTGQQAGIFGGPLFTLLKAITSIQLARRAGRELGTPVVPVFWVDAEDHDWDEIASCTILDAQHQPRTITLPKPEGGGERPIAALTLDDGVNAALAELESALAPTDFTEWVLAGLRANYRPGAGVADAFARWLELLLGPLGLVVFDSSDPAVKPLLRDLFHREVATPGRTAALATKAGEALSARGHAPQVVPQADSVSLFRLDGTRKPIRIQGDGFVAGDQTFTAPALVEEASSAPQHFSPNVLLRPLVQDTLFPTICYVAGPSELAYLGQLGEVYRHFSLPMPLIHPRATATLVDSATARFLQKYDVPFEDLQPQDEAALNRLLQSQLPPTVDASLSEAEETIRRSMEGAVSAVSSVDPTLAGAARTTLGKMDHELKALRGKVIQAAKRRDETLRRQFIRARAQTFPQGHPQERTLSVVHFLNLYGPALIERLIDELPIDLGKHWVLSI
jgi:bacillithiol biosynthesis cysteine-adding enzyme BshC